MTRDPLAPSWRRAVAAAAASTAAFALSFAAAGAFSPSSRARVSSPDSVAFPPTPIPNARRSDAPNPPPFEEEEASSFEEEEASSSSVVPSSDAARVSSLAPRPPPSFALSAAPGLGPRRVGSFFAKRAPGGLVPPPDASSLGSASAVSGFFDAYPNSASYGCTLDHDPFPSPPPNVSGPNPAGFDA